MEAHNFRTAVIVDTPISWFYLDFTKQNLAVRVREMAWQWCRGLACQKSILAVTEQQVLEK